MISSNMLPYNLFLDDFRKPEQVYADPDTKYFNLDWVIVKNYREFVLEIWKRFEKLKILPQIISFDHDLAIDHYDTDFSHKGMYTNISEKTGYDCAKWLINFYLINKIDKLPQILIHTKNPVGIKNIESLIDNFERFKSVFNKDN